MYSWGKHTEEAEEDFEAFYLVGHSAHDIMNNFETAVPKALQRKNDLEFKGSRLEFGQLALAPFELIILYNNLYNVTFHYV